MSDGRGDDMRMRCVAAYRLYALLFEIGDYVLKLRSSLGPIWPAARASAAMVIEKTVPATPIVDEATTPSNVRAPVALPL